MTNAVPPESGPPPSPATAPSAAGAPPAPPPPTPQAATADMLNALADRLGRDQVFGPPVERNGSVLVPVARVRAGGGGGGGSPSGGSGAGVMARPVGAFSIAPDGKVGWHPVVDVNRIILGGQIAFALLGVVALVRSLGRHRHRHHGHG